MTKPLILIVFSVIAHVTGYLFLFCRIEPFNFYFYVIAWWSYICFLDSIYVFKTGKFIVLNRLLPLLIVISCGFWCVFEIINLRLQNWFYISLPEETYHRYTGYLLAYGTVIPAIYVTKEIIYLMTGRIKFRGFKLKNYPFYAISLGIITLLLTLFLPKYFFAFAWAFLALIMDGYNYMKGNESFMREIEEGSIGSMVSAVLSGLVCGLLWELWNFWSVSKWIYTVPFFEGMKLFEMPVPGYIGFLAFGLETVAFMNFLKGIRSSKVYICLTIIAAMVSVSAFIMIDSKTVFSYAARIEQLDFIDKNRLKTFVAGGIKTSYGIDAAQLDKEEQEKIKLLHLKGLGFKNFTLLNKNNIKDIKSLSLLDENTLSEILMEKNLMRIRVYLNAAKRYHPQD